jgi:DNA mismatch repair protein MutS2
MDSIFQKLDFDRIKDKIKHYALSKMGKDKVDAIYFEKDFNKIEDTLNILCEFKSLLETDSPFPIDGLKDIRESLAKCTIENYSLTSKDFVDMLDTLKVSRQIKMYFSKRKNKYPMLYSFTENLYHDKTLEYNIEKTFDDNGNVRDNASKELEKIRQKIIFLSAQINKVLEKVLKRVSEDQFTQEDIVTQRDGRFVIPIKVEHKRHVPGFIHSSSASGATVFIEPAEALDLNNEIRSLQFEETREIDRILRVLTGMVKERYESLHGTIDILAETEFIFCKANYAIEIIAYKPVLNTKGLLNIITGIHPLLLLKHKRSEIVPLNFNLGNKFNTLIITGPNAGGKSVALKTVGILVLMLQCGLLIPASPDSDFCLFDKVFIDIGDEQSIENDLSTFSSHLLNLKYILDNVNRKSLVLLDEIGEGTDPLEGGAIAAAILSRLSKIEVRTVATTHQSSLKVFAYKTPGIENGAMEFSKDSLTPTYKYREGIPGSSYAIEIATRMGLPQYVISGAKDFIGEDKNKLEKILEDLENKLQHYESESKKISSERSSLQNLIEENKKKSHELDKEKKQVKSTAIKEAQEIISNMNSRIEKTIKEIREKNASKDIIHEAKQTVSKVKNEYKTLLNKLDQKQAETAINFKINDFVKWITNQVVGKVIAVDEEKRVLTIDFGNIKMALPEAEIEILKEEDSANFFKTTKHSDLILTKPVSTEIDLRGKYGSEAIPLLDKFLDDAYLNGLNRVDIIHGKGTGALKNKITEFLKSHDHVKSFRLGEWNEGGAGVTVVEVNSNK